MKKEIRTELRILNKAKRKVDRDWKREQIAIRRAFAEAERQHESNIAFIMRRDKKAERAGTKELTKINRRILILEGRLA